LAAAAWAVVEFHGGRVRRGAIALALGGLVVTQLVLSGHETLSPMFSTCGIAATIRPALTPGGSPCAARRVLLRPVRAPRPLRTRCPARAGPRGCLPSILGKSRSVA